MSERVAIYSEVECEAAQALVRELIRVVRSFRLYEGNHPTLQGMLRQLRKRWEAATVGGPVALHLREQQVLLGDEPIYQATSRSDVIPTVLYDHGVVGFVFKRGIEPTEARRFVEAVSTDPEGSVDFASLLWEADLKHIQVLLDSDDFDEEDPSSPEEFAEQVANLGDDEDQPVGEDYEDERDELAILMATRNSPDVPRDEDFTLSPSEEERLARLFDDDHYLGTLRHACRIVHNMARETLSAEGAESLEKSARGLVANLATAADVPGVCELLERARAMTASEHDLELRLGELTLAEFCEPQNLWSFLRGLDAQEQVEARPLAELFTRLGSQVAACAGEWLLETRHPQTVAQAMRVFGDATVAVLVPLYAGCDAGGRERIAPALLEVGTAEALTALAEDFAGLGEPDRLRLVKVIGRNKSPTIRRVLVDALTDPASEVRRGAVATLRKPDAAPLLPLLEGMLAAGIFDRREEEEVVEFFQMLARIGDGGLAKALAAHCTPRGFVLGFRRLTPIQRECLKALRRMRHPAARPVVEELRQNGSRAVREFLDDPFAHLAD